MLAVKKYFNPRRRRNSADFDSSGLVCTCPYGSPRPTSPAPPSSPVPGAAGGREGAGQDSPPLARRHQYRRSVSLGQILHRSDSSSSDISTLYNPGGRYYRDPRGSPRPHTHALHAHAHADHPDNAGHELSDFEKENLLFVRDLDNSYHRPLCHSASNASVCSAFSEDSLTGDSTPRGGSPYPGRREYLGPSKSASSSLLHSVSKEEEEEEEEEERRGGRISVPCNSSSSSPSSSPSSSFFSSSSSAFPHASVSNFRRKVSLPALTAGYRSDSSAPSSVATSSAWWTNSRPAFKTPASSHNHIQTFKPPATNLKSQTTTTQTFKFPAKTTQTFKYPSTTTQTFKFPAKTSANHVQAFKTPTTDFQTFKTPAKTPANHVSAFKTPTTDFQTFKTPAKTPANHVPAFKFPAKTPTNHVPAFKFPAKTPANHVPSFTAPSRSLANERASGDVTMLLTNHSLSLRDDVATAWLPNYDSELKDSITNATKPLTSTTTTATTTTPTNTTTTTTTTTTTSTTTTPQGRKEVTNVKKEKEEEKEGKEEEGGGGGGEGAKRQFPMAFTIDISDSNSNSCDSSANKKLDITGSISRWAPKHRRNLSLTKVDEHKKVEERASKPPLGRPRSGTVGAAAGLAGLTGRRGGAGYHSEGYFSSDQDDEGPRRADLKSPRSPRTPELRSPQTPQRLVRSSSQDSAKGTSLRKQGSKSEGRACCKADKKPTLAEVTGRSRGDKNKAMDKSAEGRRHNNSGSNSLSSSNHTLDMKQKVPTQDTPKEEKDDVSEAGTYTIEKDSSSPEVEQARSDIDRVFGVSGTESEVEVGSALTPRGPPPPDEPWTHANAIDQEKYKSPGSLSRNSPNWIQQWAAQVAEHTKATEHKEHKEHKGTQGTTRSPRIPPSLSSSQESEGRPRRKLPTPPTAHHGHTHTHTHGHALHKSNGGVEVSDCETPTKGRLLPDPMETLPRGQDDYDTSRDFLRHTERIVTSLQARVDPCGTLRGASFESHDSGGDSDLDTSTSYPIQDEERLTKQLKARLRLVGIEGAKTPPIASPRRPAVEKFRRERSIVSDGGYDGFAARVEDGSGQSDSSSDGSDHGSAAKDARKVENNPPLKFNRAFSLRRARLGCDEHQTQPAQPIKPPSPIDKKKQARPSSAGSLSTSRKVPLGHTKSQSVGGMKSGPPHSTTSTSSAKSSSANDFSRGDGGRFSLRLPRSGSTSAVSKSPSRASTRKEVTTGGGGRRGAAPRSNSTLSAKEVDFQNWKRRKNYDPMKAAAEGRKKVTNKGSEKVLQSGPASTSERSPSPPGSLLRSASFHGTEGMGAAAGRWPRPRPHHLYPSEDEGPYSLEEEQAHPVPHCSPLRRSPTSPQQLCSPHTTSPAHQPHTSSRARRTAYALSDEGEAQVTSPTRKTSLDESGSEGKRSPISSTRGIVSSRSKAKMEALDNLVISTIHSLSVKVRTTSETLLQKLKSQYDEEGDRAALLEEVLAHLSESDQALAGGGAGRSTSRELAGILRNLKKIEHALEVIDRVMVGDDDDDDDDDDDAGVVGGPDWGESDY